MIDILLESKPVIPDSGFLSLLAFVGELVLATSVFVFRLKRRKLWFLWLILSLGGMVLFAYLWSHVKTSYLGLKILFSIIFYTACYFGTLGCVKSVFKVSIFASVFLVTAGYSTQHFVYKLIQIVISTVEKINPSFYDNKVGIAILYFVFVVLAWPISYLLFGRHIQKKVNLDIQDSKLLLLSSVLLLFAIVLNLIFETYMDSSNLAAFIVGCLFDMVCCGLSIFIEFEMLKNQSISDDYDNMKAIWESEKRQMEISKDNIEYIRVLIHDMKHEIQANSELIPVEQVKDLNSRISAFGHTVDTGSEILDLVIAERTIVIEREHVNLSLIADGKKLSFMRESDCYSLFMNILDNAIDAVKKLPENSREISLSVRESMGMLMIHEVNPYQGQIIMSDGLPMTTKKDKMSHGLGTKSIKIIVENYSGECVISTQNGLYSLDILLPTNKNINISDED